MLEDTISIAMNIITWAGTARSDYMFAIELAKENRFEEAKQKMLDAEENYTKAHGFHYEFITQEAMGKELMINLLLIHAEDQLMITESFKVLSQEIFDIYKRIEGE